MRRKASKANKMRSASPFFQLWSCSFFAFSTALWEFWRLPIFDDWTVEGLWLALSPRFQQKTTIQSCWLNPSGLEVTQLSSKPWAESASAYQDHGMWISDIGKWLERCDQNIRTYMDRSVLLEMSHPGLPSWNKVLNTRIVDGNGSCFGDHLKAIELGLYLVPHEPWPWHVQKNRVY